MKAHDFIEAADSDDHECVRCEVHIAPGVHMTFALRCPAGDCQSGNNPGRGCVFIRQVDVGSRCIFCGRTGGMFPVPEDAPDLDYIEG